MLVLVCIINRIETHSRGFMSLSFACPKLRLKQKLLDLLCHKALCLWRELFHPLGNDSAKQRVFVVFTFVISRTFKNPFSYLNHCQIERTLSLGKIDLLFALPGRFVFGVAAGVAIFFSVCLLHWFFFSRSPPSMMNFMTSTWSSTKSNPASCSSSLSSVSGD